MTRVGRVGLVTFALCLMASVMHMTMIPDLAQADPGDVTGAQGASGVPMHRVYNPNSGEHFYTQSLGEKNHLVTVGWIYEGVGWCAPQVGLPVYRLYNPNAGDHFYTLSAGERDHLISVGWLDEGVGWQSNPDTATGVPLYRAYNPNAVAGSHNYTVSYGEQLHLVTVGWMDEGVAWHGLPSSDTCAGGTTGNYADPVQLAISISVPADRFDESRTPDCVTTGYCAADTEAVAAYIRAKQVAQQKGGRDGLPDLLASCDRFVATVLKASGVDTAIPWGPVPSQSRYLASGGKMPTGKWVQVPNGLQNAVAGDVWVSSGHIAIFVGMIDGKYPAIAHASYGVGSPGDSRIGALDTNLVHRYGNDPAFVKYRFQPI